MHLEERAYSVLIASAAENFNAGLSSLLPCAKYSPALTVSSISAAKRAVAERAYDYIIINAPLPDGPGTRFAIDACNSANTVVLLLVRADLLIRELKMDEPEAHRYIEKQAMDRCVTRREIAAEIIKLYSQ